MNQLSKLLICVCLLSAISGCFKQDKAEQTLLEAVKIETSDECHLCGMIISEFPGPKGELYRNDVNPEESRKVKKFCSTQDMFSFYLDPENTRNITQLFVHDMSMSPWQSPNDEHFIDAKTAWYVAGSTQMGAMGKTLASFASQKAAQQFADKFGGKVIRFSEITMELLME